MLEDFRDASLLEFAAFFELKQFITGDIEAVSTQFLTQGYDGENIANLAFGINTTGLEEMKSFRLALKETGLDRLPSQKESLWIAIRFHLGKIINSSPREIETLGKLVSLHQQYREIELFERPDCDKPFREKKKTQPFLANKFVAQEWGIEKLYGIYYSSDDWAYGWDGSSLPHDEWLVQRKKEQREDALSEARRVLEKFYSLTTDLPSDLVNLRDFKNFLLY